MITSIITSIRLNSTHRNLKDNIPCHKTSVPKRKDSKASGIGMEDFPTLQKDSNFTGSNIKTCNRPLSIVESHQFLHNTGKAVGAHLSTVTRGTSPKSEKLRALNSIMKLSKDMISALMRVFIE